MKKSLKVPKGVIRHHNRRTDNIMTKGKKTDKTMVDEILHRKLKIGQPKAHRKFQIGKQFAAPLVAPVVLLLSNRTIILYGNRVEYESPTKLESRPIKHRIYAEIVADTTTRN